MRCSRCKTDKETSEFSKNTRWCKSCYRDYYKSRAEIIKKRVKAAYRMNRNDKLLYAKLYREANPNRVSVAKKRSRLKKYSWYRERARGNQKKMNDWARKRRISSPQYRLSCNMRGRIRSALRGTTKSASTAELIGCSIEFLKFWLQSEFQDGMTWTNYGKWHVDHIRPCCSYDLTKPQEQKMCFNFRNLQPLWAIDNLIKNGQFKHKGKSK